MAEEHKQQGGNILGLQTDEYAGIFGPDEEVIIGIVWLGIVWLAYLPKSSHKIRQL